MSDFIGIRRATNGFVINIGKRVGVDDVLVAVDAGELAQTIDNWVCPPLLPAPAKPKRPARKPASK